jgi:sugar-specific transcriptional regulator TrmB
LSYNRITKLLSALGFSNLDAKIYIYVAKLGPLSDEEIAERLEIGMEQVVPILGELVKRGVITPVLQNQLVYSALSFEDLLDELIESEIIQTGEIKNNRHQLISFWRNTLKVNEDSSQ